MMKRKEIVDILNRFENENPVEEWTIDGIHVWPMIKIDLFFRWLKKIDGRYQSGGALKDERDGVLKKAYLTLKSTFELIFLAIRPVRKKEHVLFMDSRPHRSVINNQFRNRFYTSLISYIKENHSEIKVLFLNDDNQYNHYPQDELIYFSNKYNRALKLFFLFKKMRFVNNLPKYDVFLSIFGKNGHQIIDDKFFSDEVNNELRSIKGQAFLSQLLIKKFRIKIAFELCYYSGSRYGFNIAARGKGVKTIEIQHGGMGPEHISYSGWSKFPQEGYEMMPSTTWLWDDVSHDLLNEWVSKQGYHQCVMGGNPWFAFLFNRQDDYKNEFPEDKKIILYTLQDNEIVHFILKAIQLTSPDYQWWIRMHPNRLNARDKIIQQLKGCDVYNKVVLDKATELPLPAILFNISIHISAFSGSISEAALLGKFSIIIDEIGVSSYQRHIDNGLAIADLSKDEKVLNELIELFSVEQSRDLKKRMTNKHEKYKYILDGLIDEKY